MDLVDLIQEKRFLGQEFLTWLWWKSEERGGSIILPDRGDVAVIFEKHMLLEVGEGDTNEKIICSGLQSELQEARTGLQMGKKLEQARIQLIAGDYEYGFTLAAAVMEFRSVKLPKTAETEAGDKNPEEQEGMVLERIYLFEELTAMMDGFFKLFLEVRLSDNWKDELVRIRSWVGKEED